MDDEPFTTEFVISDDVNQVADELIEQWELCDDPRDYAEAFPDIDVLTGSQPLISGI